MNLKDFFKRKQDASAVMKPKKFYNQWPRVG